MPGKKKVSDGPICDDPGAVAAAWDSAEVVIDPVGRGLRLVVDSANGKIILPTRENMVHNAPVLLELAKNMHARDRFGADPIDCIALMTCAFYEKKIVYKALFPNANMKTIAYNQAWVLHKMVSRIRNSVPKHTTTREPELKEIFRLLKEAYVKRVKAAGEELPPQSPVPAAYEEQAAGEELFDLLLDDGYGENMADDHDVEPQSCPFLELEYPENDDIFGDESQVGMDVDEAPASDRAAIDEALASSAAPRGGERLKEFDAIEISDSPCKAAPAIPMSQMTPQDRLLKLTELLNKVNKAKDVSMDSSSISAAAPSSSSKGLPMEGLAAQTAVQTVAVADPGPALTRGVSVDDLETQICLDVCDTLVATEIAAHLPATQPLSPVSSPPPLHRTSAPPSAEVNESSAAADDAPTAGKAVEPDVVGEKPLVADGELPDVVGDGELPEKPLVGDGELPLVGDGEMLPEKPLVGDGEMLPEKPLVGDGQGLSDDKVEAPSEHPNPGSSSLAPVSPMKDEPSRDEQMKLAAAAKAKAKAGAKAKAKAGAKAKAKGKAKAKAKAASKAKAKRAAKAKAKAPKAKAKAPPPSIDEIMTPVVHPNTGMPVEPAKLPLPPRPVMKRPSSASTSRKSKSSKAPAGAKTEKVEDAPKTEPNDVVKSLQSRGLVPHTFGGRGRPHGGWALEKYARTAAEFKETIEPHLGDRTKNKAQMLFCKLVQSAKKAGNFSDGSNFDYIKAAASSFFTEWNKQQKDPAEGDEPPAGGDGDDGEENGEE